MKIIDTPVKLSQYWILKFEFCAIIFIFCRFCFHIYLSFLKLFLLLKGKKLWTVKLPSSITTMETMDYKPRAFTAVLVALNNCEVHIYKEKYLVDVINMPDVVTGMKFGKFGREDGTLVMTTRGEAISCHSRG